VSVHAIQLIFDFGQFTLKHYHLYRFIYTFIHVPSPQHTHTQHIHTYVYTCVYTCVYTYSCLRVRACACACECMCAQSYELRQASREIPSKIQWNGPHTILRKFGTRPIRFWYCALATVRPQPLALRVREWDIL